MRVYNRKKRKFGNTHTIPFSLVHLVIRDDGGMECWTFDWERLTDLNRPKPKLVRNNPAPKLSMPKAVPMLVESAS